MSLNTSIPKNVTLTDNVSTAPVQTDDDAPAQVASDNAKTSAAATTAAKILATTDILAKGGDPAGLPWVADVNLPPVGGDSHSLIAQHFEPLASELSPPSGPVGQAFSPDTSDTPKTRLAPLPAAAAKTVKSKEPEVVKAPLVQHSLQLVDQMSARLLQKQNESAANQTANFGQFSPRAQALFAQAANHIAQAMAAQRAFSETKKVTETKKSSETKDALEVDGADSASDAASSDIEIPSPAVTQLEQAVQSIKSGMQAQAEDTGISWLSPEVFKTGDVMALATLVMMQGATVQDNMLRDLMQQVQSEDQQKDQLNQLLTQAKSDDASMKQQIDTEYSQLSTEGLIGPGVTLTQYEGWRTLSYGQLSQQTDANGNTTYSYPSPELGPAPTTDDIPSWIKNGNTTSASGTSSSTSTGNEAQTFAVPPNVINALNTLFTDSQAPGNFDDWLESTVGLIPASSLSEATINSNTVQAFLATAQTDPNSLAPAAATSSPAALPTALTTAATALGDAEIAQGLLGSSIISNDYIQSLKTALNAQLSPTPPLNTATMTAYKQWLVGTGAQQLQKDSAQLTQAKSYLIQGSSWELDATTSWYVDQEPQNPDLQNAQQHQANFDAVVNAMTTDNPQDQMYEQPTSVSIDFSKNPPTAVGSRAQVTVHGGGNWNQTWDFGYKLDPNQKQPPGYSSLMSIVNSASQSSYQSGQVNIPTTSAAPFDVSKLATSPDFTGATAGSSAAATPASPIASDLTTLDAAISAVGKASDPTSTWYSYVDQIGLIPSTSTTSSSATPVALAASTAVPNNPLLSQTGTITTFEASYNAIQNQLDSISSLSDIDSMRLQSMMDERSKLLESLSDMLKADADLSQAIRENIK